ncbi:MAG: hypothetical protein PHW04_17760, partial [Candidatus Wallbacteria bacterium]|nr:hypothetical protein [Candidatus Wallbacteria bacterium]
MNKFILCLLFILVGLAAVQAGDIKKKEKVDAVYIPYDNLQKVFSSENKGVFIPYQEFIKLWLAGQTQEVAETNPPVEAAVSEARYEGKISGSQAEFTGSLTVRVLKKGYSRLPLGFKNTAITEITDKNHKMLLSTDEGSPLAVFPEPGIYELSLKFVTRISKDQDGFRLDFQVPGAGVSRLELTVPEPNLEFELTPLCTGSTKHNAGTSVFTAFLGSDSSVNLKWRSTSVESVQAAFSSEELRRIYLTPDSVQSVSTFNIRLQQGGIDRLLLEIPGEYSVISLKGESVASQKLEQTGGKNMLEISLFSKMDKDFSLVLETELKSGDGIQVLPISVKNASRSEGRILIFRNRETACSVESREHLFQIDAEGDESGFICSYCYRFSSGDYNLKLLRSRILPQFSAGQTINIRIGENETLIEDCIKLTVKSSGVFSVNCIFPSSLAVTAVEPEDCIEDWQIVESGKNTAEIRINFKEKAQDSKDFILKFHQDFKAGISSYSIPDLHVCSASTDSGYITVSAPLCIMLNTRNLTALVPCDLKIEEGDTENEEQDLQNESSSDTALGFRFYSHPYSGTLDLTTRSSSVSVENHLSVSLDPNQCSLKGLLSYNIQYAGITTLEIAVPSGSAENLHLDGNFINEKKVNPNDESGTILLILQHPVSGVYELSYSLDLPLKLKETAELEIPLIRTSGTFSETGFIGLSKDPVLQVECLKHPEEIEVKELKNPLFAGQSVFSAYKWDNPDAQL